MRVAIVGGTGSFGLALARRLVDAGDDVVIGSRDADRAAAAAAGVGTTGTANAAAVRGADIVVLAVTADAAVATAEELAEALRGTPTLSVGSELRFAKGGVRPSAEPRSLAERVADRLDAPVAAGLHSLAAATLGGDEPPDEDALVCGDDTVAKALALELAGKVCAGRAIDAGPLESARALEGLTAVIVNVNKKYKVHAGIRVTGLR